MKKSTRPPTKRMIAKLQECLEKEQTNAGNNIPCLPEEMKSSLAGLYKRGLIDTRMEYVNNKKLLCIFVTDSGRKLIEGNSPD
ncbi:MAG: hypothetical protein ABIO82_02895 [Ginsengibacter sp.]